MSSKATLMGYGAPLCVALMCGTITTDAFAQAGGRPLILDTQTGIQSGAGGNVLQTGPLNGQGMVPARPLATLPEVPAQGQQPIVVSPYIEVQPGGYSGPQGYAISPGNQSRSGSAGIRGLRSSAGYSGGLQGMPTSVQPHAQPQPRSQPPRAQPQTPEQPRSQPRAQPTTSIAPTSAATDTGTISRTGGTRPRAPSRSSDPHTATGTVTSLQ